MYYGIMQKLLKFGTFLFLGAAKITAEKHAGKCAASTDTAQYISQQ